MAHLRFKFFLKVKIHNNPRGRSRSGLILRVVYLITLIYNHTNSLGKDSNLSGKLKYKIMHSI